MDDKTNLQLIQDHFGTLRTGADNVVSAAQNMADPVAEYHTGTVSVSNSISSEAWRSQRTI
ncbi:hypothetical protein ABIA39_005162 [Nocardia sp. GAS34]|uniref:hypothetical protein n=1 Tax=unclassified Nocardia TaxID=2637762 RepID=UPI003D1EB3CB